MGIKSLKIVSNIPIITIVCIKNYTNAVESDQFSTFISKKEELETRTSKLEALV